MDATQHGRYGVFVEFLLFDLLPRTYTRLGLALARYSKVSTGSRPISGGIGFLVLALHNTMLSRGEKTEIEQGGADGREMEIRRAVG